MLPVAESVPTEVLTVLSFSDLGLLSRDLITNARLLHPEEPIANLLPEIISMAEQDFLAQLDALLQRSNAVHQTHHLLGKNLGGVVHG